MSSLRGLIAAGVGNPVFVNLLMVCMLAGGGYAALSMQREAYPDFSLDIIRIDVAYPGASPQDVEQSVCAPIEDALSDLEGITELTSAAHENLANIWFVLRSSRRTAGEVQQQVRDRVKQITTFPPEVEEPVVSESFVRTDVINVALYGAVPERTLKEWAQEVESDLRAIPGVSQVRLSGVRLDEIIVELSEQALRAYGLTFGEVMAAVARSSLDRPAGTLKTGREEFTLRVKGQRFTAADYEQLVIIDRPDALVRLGQLADVRDGFAEAVTRGRFNGQPAVLVTVFRAPGEDTLHIAEQVRAYVARQSPGLPQGLAMTVWADNSEAVHSRLDMLVNNALLGFALVLLVLTFFLELRLALWVAIGIPIAFAGALLIVYAVGETLNLISLFALIMVSGIIVDDAIVIAENVHTRRKAGLTPQLAAIEGTSEVALPVLGASVTTIIAFVPLLFVQGVMGKFIHVLPVVVIAAVVASGVEAFGVLPSHLAGRRPRPGARTTDPDGPGRPSRWSAGRRAVERAMNALITGAYRPVYRWALRYRVLVVAVAAGVLVVAIGVVLGGRTAFVLYPKEDGNLLRARVRFPEGTPAGRTAEAVEQLEAAAWSLNHDPTLQPASEGDLVRQVYSITGEHLEFLAYRGDNLCEVRVELMPAEARRIPDDHIIARWQERIGEIPDAVQVSLARHQLAPSEDYPIEVRLLGHDLDVLAAAGDRVAEQLRTYAGVRDVHLDLIPGKRELHVSLQPAAHALGLTLEDVATQLRQGFFGGEAVRLQRAGEEVVVRVRYPEAERLTLADLEGKAFRTRIGHEIPFREAVQVDWSQGYATIRHEDSLRRVRVLADVDERLTNAERICTELEENVLPAVVGQYDGVRYRFGGTRHHLNESLDSLFNGFAMALLAMYAVLAGLLRSYVQPAVIMLAVPFGLVGAVVGHALLGYDLTMMSLFGLVALSGVVVNDSLVLLDVINAEIKAGGSVREAVARAGEARFRAVVLTTVTTVAGLMPLLQERSSQAQPVIPMAISLVFGLLFATGLTLLVVPALYLLVNDARRAVRWLREGGAYPTPEAVEEAYAARCQALAQDGEGPMASPSAAAQPGSGGGSW